MLDSMYQINILISLLDILRALTWHFQFDTGWKKTDQDKKKRNSTGHCTDTKVMHTKFISSDNPGSHVLMCHQESGVSFTFFCF